MKLHNTAQLALMSIVKEVQRPSEEEELENKEMVYLRQALATLEFQHNNLTV